MQANVQILKWVTSIRIKPTDGVEDWIREKGRVVGRTGFRNRRKYGDSRSTFDRGPSKVGSLGLSCRYKRFLSCIGSSSRSSTNIFSSLATFSGCLEVFLGLDTSIHLETTVDMKTAD